eukprot:Filipodium_phascolosomae@DN2775_c0_g1_i10.p1
MIMTDLIVPVIAPSAVPDLQTPSIGLSTAEDSCDLQLLELIGQGGNGEVYRGVVDSKKGGKSTVAVKIVSSKAFCSSKAKETTFKNAMLCLLSMDHPNVLRMESIYDCQGRSALVSELCNGLDVVKLIQTHEPGTVDIDLCVKVFWDMLMGLGHLHEKEIIHCDMKLDNLKFRLCGGAASKSSKDLTSNIKAAMLQDYVVILDLDSCLLVKDVGLVRSESNRIARGTFQYMPPEAFKGVYSFAGDVFSAGVTLYCLVDGHFPFRIRSGATVDELINAVSTMPRFKPHLWGRLPGAEHTVRAMLNARAPSRPSVSAIMREPWLLQYMSKLKGYSQTPLIAPSLRHHRIALGALRQSYEEGSFSSGGHHPHNTDTVDMTSNECSPAMVQSFVFNGRSKQRSRTVAVPVVGMTRPQPLAPSPLSSQYSNLLRRDECETPLMNKIGQYCDTPVNQHQQPFVAMKPTFFPVAAQPPHGVSRHGSSSSRAAIAAAANEGMSSPQRRKSVMFNLEAIDDSFAESPVRARDSPVRPSFAVAAVTPASPERRRSTSGIPELTNLPPKSPKATRKSLGPISLLMKLARGVRKPSAVTQSPRNSSGACETIESPPRTTKFVE